MATGFIRTYNLPAPSFFKGFNNRVIRGHLLGAMRKNAQRIMKEELKPLTAPWGGEQPEWKYNLSAATVTNDQISFSVTPVNPSSKGSLKFLWLDDGTDHRWAKMGKDFKRKSTPNSLKVQRGRDDVWLRGKRLMERRGFTVPEPGIEPRNWLLLIYLKELRYKTFEKDIGQVIDKMVLGAVSGKYYWE